MSNSTSAEPFIVMLTSVFVRFAPKAMSDSVPFVPVVAFIVRVSIPANPSPATSTFVAAVVLERLTTAESVVPDTDAPVKVVEVVLSARKVMSLNWVALTFVNV